jgi:prepilin-type N-terminal cleavage/methylation domain-containing protein
MNNAKAFTLVEILIVVVLLGLLAGIVIPTLANSTSSAKDSALATNIKLLRRFILLYKGHHLEVGPGYPDGDTTVAPTEQALIDQATLSSNSRGQTAAVGTSGFERGPYMQKLPVNPFNHKDTIEVLANGQAFPADADDSHGWIYKADTSEIRPDNTGADINGKNYYDY